MIKEVVQKGTGWYETQYTGVDAHLFGVLAVDLGASNGRVVLGEFTGERLRLRELRRFPNRPVHEQQAVHWNVRALFEEVLAGLAEAAVSAPDLRAVAIDSWAVDFGLVDRRGALLAEPRHYRDPRHAEAMEDVLGRLERSALFARTGVQIQPINTLFQLFGMRRVEPGVLDAADKLLLIPDLLNYWLTGVQRAEFTNATTTQMLHPATGDWHVELLAELGLPVRVLPPVAQPGAVLGPLRSGWFEPSPALGNVQVVHTASHDTAAAVISVPRRHSRFAYISSGTWSLLGTVVPAPVIDKRTEEWNFTNEGGVGNYRLLKNVMGLWLLQETQRILSEKGLPADVGTLLSAARAAPPFTCLFDPDDPRLFNPVDMVEAIGQICAESGQRRPANEGVLARGILESLALKYRMVLEQLETVVGTHFSELHIVGGGSHNELLNQFTADSTGRTVIAGPAEASAMGNVLVQLLALGELSSADEMGDIVRRSVETRVYFPADGEAYAQAYGYFQGLLKQREKRGNGDGSV